LLFTSLVDEKPLVAEEYVHRCDDWPTEEVQIAQGHSLRAQQ
jgi:hypothetical protein